MPGHRMFFAWFTYATLFQYFWIIPDEMLKDNMRRCAAASFFVGVASFAVSLPLCHLLGIESPVPYAGFISWTVGVVCFGVYLGYLAHKERRGNSDD